MRNWNGHRPGNRTAGALVALAAEVPKLSPAEHRAAQDRWNRWNTEAQRRYAASPLSRNTGQLPDWLLAVD